MEFCGDLCVQCSCKKNDYILRSSGKRNLECVVDVEGTCFHLEVDLNLRRHMMYYIYLRAVSKKARRLRTLSSILVERKTVVHNCNQDLRDF